MFIFAFLTVILASALLPKKLMVPDVNKLDRPMISRLGGVAIMLGITVSFVTNPGMLPVIIACGIAFVIGIVDDIKIMKGWWKPVMMIFPAIPLLLFDINSIWTIPIMALYITGMSNSMNGIDVMNCVVSGVMLIGSIALAVVLMIDGNYQVMEYAIILAGVSAGFFLFHKVPSKIFPGDSGTLVLGTAFAVIAIMGNVEFLGGIIMAPIIFNMFLYIKSHGFVEHRSNGVKSVVSRPDKLLERKEGPPTLVSLILNKPKSEQQISSTIIFLVSITSIIAVTLSVLTR